MPELHRSDNQPSLSMTRDPGGSSSDPRPEFLKPDDLKKELGLGQVQRAVPLLYRIYDAQQKGLISPSKGADFAGRLSDLVHTETGDQLLERYPDPEKLKELFKENYLGPEAVEQVWGVEIPPDRLPPQPFTDAEREAAAKYGLMLRLRIDRSSDGADLTIRKMAEGRDPTLAEDDRKLLANTTWYQAEDFYLKDTPTFGWALTSKGIIPDSTARDLVQQVELAIQIFRDSLPEQGARLSKMIEVIRQWDRYLGERFGSATLLEIQDILRGPDWRMYADELAAQPILRHLLPSAAELIFDHETSCTTSGANFLHSTTARTHSRDVDGRFVSLGKTSSVAANVDSWEPGIARVSLGLVLSYSR